MSNLILSQSNYFDNNKRSSSLKLLTAQKMIKKLLSANRLKKIEVERPKYSEIELCKKLDINKEQLKLFTGKLTKTTKAIGVDIDLKLIKLYLNTKFVK